MGGWPTSWADEFHFRLKQSQNWFMGGWQTSWADEFHFRVMLSNNFATLWDNKEDFTTSLEHLDCFPSHFRPFSPIIGSLQKRVTDRRTDGRINGQTDRPSYRDAWTHLKMCSWPDGKPHGRQDNSSFSFVVLRHT